MDSTKGQIGGRRWCKDEGMLKLHHIYILFMEKKCLG